jgi:hypothetical protein
LDFVNFEIARISKRERTHSLPVGRFFFAAHENEWNLNKNVACEKNERDRPRE